MIDTEREHVITFAEATKIPQSRPNLSTVWRWHLRGVRGVRLETFMWGGKRFTTVEALRRFQERVTAAADGGTERVETPRQRQRAIERAEQKAKDLGV